MAVKDSLKIILTANGQQKAISTDPALWQFVFSIINREGKITAPNPQKKKS